MSDLFDNLDVDGSGIITRCLDAFFQLSLPERERERERADDMRSGLVHSMGREGVFTLRKNLILSAGSRLFLVITFHKAMNSSRVFCFLAVLTRISKSMQHFQTIETHIKAEPQRFLCFSSGCCSSDFFDKS